PAEGAWSPDRMPEFNRTMDIGSAMGDPNEQFGLIAAVDVDEQGNIYVLDAQARHVKVFDSEGQFVRQLGAPGAGPGELGQAVGTGRPGPGATSLVPDVFQGGVPRLAADGPPGAPAPLPLSAGLAMRWEKRPEGRLLPQSRAIMDSTARAVGDPLVIHGPD